MAIPLESLIDIQTISSDAHIVGEVTDIRYDPAGWEVAGLKLKAPKKASGKLAAGFGKSTVLIRPERFTLNDVILLTQPIDKLKESAVPDNNNISSLSTLISMKVVTKDNIFVGNVITVMIDTDTWKVPFIVVRLEKNAIEAMKLKKGLFSKITAEIRTNIVLPATDMIRLSEGIEKLRENMTILE